MRAPAHWMVFTALVAVVSSAVSTEAEAADEPPAPPTGQIRLASGRLVDYTIHFDRNSLRDSHRQGNDLFALTSAGNLLKFELPGVRLVKEQIDVDNITCIGRGEGSGILAGLDDVQICRVDPATLALSEVAKLPSAPQWVGWARAQGNRPAGLIAVTRATRRVEREGEHWNAPYSVIHDLASRKTLAVDDQAKTFLIDSAGRFWLGSDNGEWGGHVYRVEFTSGAVAAIKPPPGGDPKFADIWDGVYGFIELGDGQIWAFGGTSHFGSNSGFITRVDLTQPRPLFAFEPPADLNKEPDPGRPSLPITHVIEEKNGLVVFSFSDVFRIDKELKSWSKFATLAISYRWGRPDAMGSYPSVRTVHPPIRAGEPYVLATVADGYVVLDGTKATSRALPGQLGAERLYRAQNTSEGVFFLALDDRLPIWTLRERGWQVASLAPPVEIDPADPAPELAKRSDQWYETSVLVGPGGTIYTVSGVGSAPGTRTTARRIRGKSEVLGRETSDLNPSASFITADGTLWNAFVGKLDRFENGRWNEVARFPEGESVSCLSPLNRDGPP